MVGMFFEAKAYQNNGINGIFKIVQVKPNRSEKEKIK